MFALFAPAALTKGYFWWFCRRSLQNHQKYPEIGLRSRPKCRKKGELKSPDSSRYRLHCKTSSSDWSSFSCHAKNCQVHHREEHDHSSMRNQKSLLQSCSSCICIPYVDSIK